jgi:hypothetical protein
MNIEEFFANEVAAAKKQQLSKAHSQQIASRRQHAHFRPFMQAFRRIGESMKSYSEVEFHESDNYAKIVLGERRIFEVTPIAREKYNVVTRFIGFKVHFTSCPIRYLRQMFTELFLRLRFGNFVRYLFSTYEYPPWDVVERRKTYADLTEVVEVAIRLCAEYVAQSEVAAKLIEAENL